MRILLGFLFRSMAERKLRTFLVLFSIAVTAALFFASNAISDTMQKTSKDRYRQLSGTAELVIRPENISGAARYISVKDADILKDDMEYVVGTLQGSALYTAQNGDMTYAAVLGISFEDLKLLNPVSLYQKSEIEPFRGNKLLISRKTADKYGFAPGDEIELEISGRKDKYKIAGICNPRGYFTDESRGISMIMPEETLDRLYDAGGKSNVIYLKLKNPAQLQPCLTRLAELYRGCTVREPFDKADLGQAATPYKLVTIFVVFMGIFITFTSFKVIALERLPAIGTFRSVGATGKTTNLVLILESLLYGVVGGAAGCILGMGALYIMALVTETGRLPGMAPVISYRDILFLFTFLFAVVLSLICAVIPVAGVSRIPVKEVILNTAQKVKENGRGLIFASLVMLAASLVIPRVIPKSPMLILIIDNACVTMALVSVVMLVPFLTGIAGRLLERSLPAVFGSTGLIAGKNIQDSKGLRNNITLLTIGVSCLLLIYSINYSAAKEVAGVFTNCTKFDIAMSYSQADDKFVRELGERDGVSGVTPTYEIQSVKVDEKNQYINWVYGIDSNSYLDFWNIQLPGGAAGLAGKLGQGRNILLAGIMRDKLGVSEGDVITLDLNGGKYEYRVAGFFDTVWNNGYMALVSGNCLKQDAGLSYYTNLYLKTNKDAEIVKTNLRGRYGKDIFSIQTRQEMLEANQQGLGSVFSILIGFSQLAMLLGIVGVLNNLIVCFIERKRYFAIYRSVGMSRSMLGRMLLLESVFSGLLGILFGLLAAWAMYEIIPFVLRLMLGPIKMYFPITTLLYISAAGVGIMILAALVPVLKSKRLSIIESIKYE